VPKLTAAMHKKLFRFFAGGLAAATDKEEIPFANREISFTFANGIYTRFRSYRTCAEWKADVVDVH
jgi:hypothetical protein